MRFADQMLSVETPFGPTEVCVTGEALHVWSSDGVGAADRSDVALQTGFRRPRQVRALHEAGQELT